MRFNLDTNTRHLFILGAGASVDYNLPTWLELKDLLKDRIETSSDTKYEFRKEMQEWLAMVGPKDTHKYQTIDECITKESVNYHENGTEVENEIFDMMSQVFEERYRDNEQGWIRLLNKAIIDDDKSIEDQLAFINYNYDSVLEKNFLNYSYLSKKERVITYSERLERLSQVSVECLHPHGHFGNTEGNLKKIKETAKTGKDGFIDAVSCHESKRHTVASLETRHPITKQIFTTPPVTLYILGLGGGLEINLRNTNFRLRISKIHITDKGNKRREEIESILTKVFKIDANNIVVHGDCQSLITNCFV